MSFAPAGVLVIEMPNPENLRMGARDFWLVPTHRRPIPPQVMEFMFATAVSPSAAAWISIPCRSASFSLTPITKSYKGSINISMALKRLLSFVSRPASPGASASLFSRPFPLRVPAPPTTPPPSSQRFPNASNSPYSSALPRGSPPAASTFFSTKLPTIRITPPSTNSR
ncbi:MAG TPA: hypothetical protein VFQ91_26205 [Bryobacteraceae bacterium]|nr:hypothetical protein [Bryobacteraceae bacterium]